LIPQLAPVNDPAHEREGEVCEGGVNNVHRA
jgi:hypothetical protein